MINNNYNKRKLNATLLPSDRAESMYQTLLSKVDFIERDLLPSNNKIGETEEFEQQVFMKLT